MFAAMAKLEAENRTFALLHIVECRGSTPRHSASMLVTDTGESQGTIGGGMLERLAVEAAIQAISDKTSRLFEARLARTGENAIGSDCGGAVTVHIAVYPRRPSLFLLGGGHVNREVAKLAVNAGFQVTVADTWQNNLLHPELPAACQKIHAEDYASIIRKLQPDEESYFVIATNHEDRAALAEVIHKPYRYLGLLSSRRKAHHFRNLLRKEYGLPESEVARLRAPLGLNIGAESPAEIAISIIAELIQLHRTGELSENQAKALCHSGKKHLNDPVVTYVSGTM